VAYESGAFRNCPVVIYDADDSNIIARTNVEAHYAGGKSIVISEEMKSIERGTHLKLLIIHESGVSEFRGIARGFFDGTREITLYDEQQREARAAVRHDLNVPAVVTGIVDDSVRKPLQPPLKVVVENMSSTGVLIKVESENFDIDCVLEINVDIGGNPALLTTKVVREQVNADKTLSFGCRFIFS